MIRASRPVRRLFFVASFLLAGAAGFAVTSPATTSAQPAATTPSKAAAATSAKAASSPDTLPKFTEQSFTTPRTVAQEAITMAQLLEEAHYNRDAIGTNYSQAISDYMRALDGQHLFFLNSDRTKFMHDYAKNVYYNVRFLGNIDPAYTIFHTYESRVYARIKWIFARLNQPINLDTDETYRADRTKSEWPSDAEAADDLWRRRLKYELISEMLNEKAVSKDTASAKTAPEGKEKADSAEAKPAGGSSAGSATTSTATSSAVAQAAAPAAKATGGAPEATASQEATPVVALSKLDRAKEKLRKRYERMLKNLSEIDQSDLSELYLSTIAGLYDPHTEYFSADTYQDFAIQMKLQLVGIGALLGLEDDNCVVKEIIPGGPADLGHQLKPNDKIIAVGQPGKEAVDVIGMKLRKIVDLIRGKKGTKVVLVVQPADAPDSTRKDIVITRDIVKLNAQRARAAVFQLPDGSGKTEPIGVITLPAFYGPAGDGDTDKISASLDVARLLADLKQQHIKGLVLDLRHNGGGYLTEAINLAGMFIGRGPVVQVKNYNGEIQVDQDDDPQVAYTGPLAVLVDRFSASAAEIVTGALQDYGRAVIIGDRSTHGKGTVQQIVELKDISPMLAHAKTKTGAVKFTIQKYYLPSGASTQLKGVTPDIILPSIDDYIPNIGEASLPHALPWDRIPSCVFDGQRLSEAFLKPLREDSLHRQATLPEFAYLRQNVDWFKAREAQKLISVNLADREKQRAEDKAFEKKMKVERAEIAKTDYPFKPYYLGTPPPPPIKAKDKNADDAISDQLEDSDTYQKADVDLREALRVVQDARRLGRDRALWVSNHAPVTVALSGEAGG